MTALSLLFTNLAAIIASMSLLWVVSVVKRDVSIVDLFWGVGFVLLACLSLVNAGNESVRSHVLCAMVTIWGLRLSGYLTWRNWGKPEDYRYAAMRDRRGGSFAVFSLFAVFGLQGLLMWIISIPVQVGVAQAGDWHGLAVVGVMLWIVGLFFESIGDYQLARFKSDPANRGRVMNRGLWKYTRHPNYFGDFLVWWGFYLVSVQPNSWWWTIVGPILMSFLLLRVSGVRLLEDSLRGRVAGYDQYVSSTSAFFPLPPKNEESHVVPRSS